MNLETLCVSCMEDDSGSPVCPKCGAPAQLPHNNTIQLAPRTVLRQQYLIGRALGHGGFGITYLAWDIGLQARLAVKEYMPSGVAGRSTPSTLVHAFSERMQEEYEWGLERFLEEARVLKKFSTHPNIVSVDTIFKDNGTAYMVMEYLEGMTFEEFLARRGGKITFETGLRIMAPIMDALASVHAEGILHRDISPDNIHLAKTGKVKLMDFGAARNALSQKSRNLSVILKEGYAPEEQYRSSGIQGPWTDVYGTAATLYHSITGRIPPPSLDRAAEDRMESPSQLGVALSPAAESALMRALSVRASDRFQSMEDFKAALTGEAPARTAAAPVVAPVVAQAPVPPAPSQIQPAPVQASQIPPTVPVSQIPQTVPVMAQPSYTPPAPPSYTPPPSYNPPPQQNFPPQPANYPPQQANYPPQPPNYPPQPPHNYGAPPPGYPPPQQNYSPHQNYGAPPAAPPPPQKNSLPKWLIPVAVVALVMLAGGATVAVKYGPDLIAKITNKQDPGKNPPGQPPQPAEQQNGGAPPQSDDERQKQLEQQAQQQPADQPAQPADQPAQDQAPPPAEPPVEQAPVAVPAPRRAVVAAVPVPAPVAPVVAVAPAVAVPAAPGYDRMVASAEDMINNSQYAEAAAVLKQAIAANPNRPQAYNTLAKDELYFLHDPAAFQHYTASLARGGSATFYVYHDHQNGEFMNYCSGWLTVSKGKVSFKADDTVHSFPPAPIKEAKKNRVFGRILSAQGKSLHAFHVRLMSGQNFNFGPSSQTPGPEADFILKSIG
jgi:serine/threonine protein kinase